ncbi:MAG: hypothetical protein ACHQ51_14045 [Elusimicrobiota bacterium]
MKLLLALLLLASFSPARAQDAPEGTRTEETDPEVIEIRDKLKSDPAIAQVVAERVARSRLISMITDAQDKDTCIAAALKWIQDDPDSAAHVMIGLAHDDNVGKPEFENNLVKQLSKSYENNPGAEKNLFGRLKKSGHDSKLLSKQAQDISPDEQAEIVRKLFEGQGASTNKVISGKDQENGNIPDKPAVAPATSFNGIYDRLGAGNLRGYSPQLMSLQSSLNARRPPGAPPLIETGKLDYATLSYPGYGMKYDVNNLDARLRNDRILALARLAGRTLTARDWKDPELEMKLAATVPADKLSPHLKHAAELAAKARAALAAFLTAAEKSKNPNGITRGLLMELGRDQKEAARWITAAALEEELARLEPLENFLTPELLAVIDAVPAAPTERDAYKRRGEGLKAKVAQVKANAEKAIALLESDGWAAALGDVDKLVAANRELKANVGRDVEDYARTPYKIADARLIQPRWREMLDDAAVRWAPTLAYSREVAMRRGRLSRLLSVFGMISAGDADGAHNALVNENGGR